MRIRIVNKSNPKAKPAGYCPAWIDDPPTNKK
jgi:hypothetical protein